MKKIMVVTHSRRNINIWKRRKKRNKENKFFGKL